MSRGPRLLGRRYTAIESVSVGGTPIFFTMNVAKSQQHHRLSTMYIYRIEARILLKGAENLTLFLCSFHSACSMIMNIFHYNDVIMSAMESQVTSVSIVYSTVCSDADQRKHQSYASLALVRGIHRWPVNSPHKWPVRKCFQLMASSFLSKVTHIAIGICFEYVA